MRERRIREEGRELSDQLAKRFLSHSPLPFSGEVGEKVLFMPLVGLYL
jgi:hypothetical protein